MLRSLFNFELPESLIAQVPLPERDGSRLLVMDRAAGRLAHRAFRELPTLLRSGDLLIFNDSRVIPARLIGQKPSGGRAELLLIEPLDPDQRRWKAMGQSSKPLRAGSEVRFEQFNALIDEVHGEGFFTVTFDRGGEALEQAIAREGRIPLPPYVRREPNAGDIERYQTILARARGSVAAPTAALHFSDRVLAALDAAGVHRSTVTLHVGPGTFLPMRAERVADHVMHEERYEVPSATAEAFAACRARGGRVVAVGTTSVRTLESAFDNGALRVGPGRTSIFITPSYRFRAVDALITNFHLPESTLLMLVCAFAGFEQTLAAYREAVSAEYRFFSYGDAMLIE